MTDYDIREEQLRSRLEKLKILEDEITKREDSIKEKDKSKKQILLRLSPTVWNDIAKWAEDDYRSINGQIEYLLAEAVRKRKQGRD